MKINLTSIRNKDLTSLGDLFYSKIISEKLKLKILSHYEYSGMAVFIKEIGDDNNIAMAIVHNPSNVNIHQCHIKAYEVEKTGVTSSGCKIIEYEGRKYLCSVEGSSPEENDVIAICFLAKILNIKTIIALENFDSSNSYLINILKNIA